MTLYLRNLRMRMMPQNQLIFDKSVFDLCPCKKRLFCHNQTKWKLMFILQIIAKSETKKT
jgi:hypothetical protein